MLYLDSRVKKHWAISTMLVLLLCTASTAIAAPAAEEEMMMDLSEFSFETVGPQGEEPVSYEEIYVTPSNASEIRSRGLRAALLMHTSGDWVNAVLAGARSALEELGIEVVAEADAEFDSNKQRTDIETALALDPDIIITLIVDPVTGAEALRPAIDAGVEIVLLSNLPSGFVHGQDYASIVTDDLFQMGRSTAELINDHLGGSGNVGLLFHDAAYYVTNQRDSSVEAVLTRDFPGINILARRGIAGPDFVSDAEVATSAMLTEFPEIDVIYAPWEAGPADGAVAALRAAGRDDVGVFTMDLGSNNVLDMVRGGNVQGFVADLPFDLGATMARIGALAVLGEDTPAFVTVPAIKVTRENVPTQWERSLNRELPAEILAVLE